MRRNMVRLLESFREVSPGEEAAGVFPLVNVTEDHDNYFVRAELPGVKGEHLDLTVIGDSLTISGERMIPSENEGAKYHRRERQAGKFSRILTLPGQVASEKVEASCADGVLTVLLPKPASAKPTEISVKTAS
jgi:HSP20 family protein